MTPQQRADKLIETFYYYPTCIKVVKQIIEALEHFDYACAMYDDFETLLITTTDKTDPCEYWQKVMSILEEQQ